MIADILPLTPDKRDILYTVAGLSLLAVSLRPALSRFRLVNLPLLYVLAGAGLALAGLPVLDPLHGDVSAKVIEHAAEIIVIISLAGAGLAIDTKASWHNWQATWRLLIVSMPLTIAAVFSLGVWVVGLPWASAMLLAAALAPTDPVLARSVQVGPPGGGEEPIRVALTAEAGLNDGLAFPFIYLAISIATYGLGSSGVPDWGWEWLGYDLFYRVIAGWFIGYGCGWALYHLVFSRFGDASQGAKNPTVVILAATFIAYGVTEFFDAYGFLAVFAAARAGKSRTRQMADKSYEKHVHHGADQLEQILLVLLMLWLGMFIGGGALAGLTTAEGLSAVLILFLVRPLSGLVALSGYACTWAERFKVAFFGIRGMGTVFYIAYAQNHAEFQNLEGVWRIALVAILISIVVHGFSANLVFKDE